MRDAHLRGRSPFVVAFAVIVFFPLGLIAWLYFRPDPKGKSFDLDDYREQ